MRQMPEREATRHRDAQVLEVARGGSARRATEQMNEVTQHQMEWNGSVARGRARRSVDGTRREK